MGITTHTYTPKHTYSLTTQVKTRDSYGDYNAHHNKYYQQQQQQYKLIVEYFLHIVSQAHQHTFSHTTHVNGINERHMLYIKRLLFSPDLFVVIFLELPT